MCCMAMLGALATEVGGHVNWFPITVPVVLSAGLQLLEADVLIILACARSRRQSCDVVAIVAGVCNFGYRHFCLCKLIMN